MTQQLLDTVLHRFEQISRIPRPSRHEQQIQSWLREWAESNHWATRNDAVGNLSITVPAAGGSTAAPIALQAHVDMVCEKTPDSTHDFMNDPIHLVREAEWLRADRTTLGADNGIGVAMMMTLAEVPGLRRPPLQLLFTVDEETGLNGAVALDPALLSANILINLDSEEEGVFTIGCAGGKTTVADLPITREGFTGELLRITIDGLHGGHSGIDIHLGRANAIKLLVELLETVASLPVRLIQIEGGLAHNAIPRHALALVGGDTRTIAIVDSRIREKAESLGLLWREIEPALNFKLNHEPAGSNQPAMTRVDAARVLNLLREAPHGVLKHAEAQPNVVETSCNLASVRTMADSIQCIISQRSIHMDQLRTLNSEIGSFFQKHGATANGTDGYPAWSPSWESPLLAQCRELWKQRHGSEPRIQVIHAGLECGVLADHCPGLDMISLGPTIRDPHSPSERVEIASIGRVTEYVAALLGKLA